MTWDTPAEEIARRDELLKKYGWQNLSAGLRLQPTHHVKTVDRWRRGESPRTDAERRLRFTYQVLRLLVSEDSPHTVRAWLIGLNPQLGDIAPADAISEGKLQDVMIAAHAFRSGG